MSMLILKNKYNDITLALDDVNNANHLLWELEGRCNMNCLYCYDSRVRNGGASKECIAKWITYLKDSNYKYIHITGGEPTLHPQLMDIVKALKHKKICITTNLTNNINLFESCLKHNYLFSLAISLDSFETSVNDITRAHTKQVLTNIETILKWKKQYESKVEIRIHAVLTKVNIDTTLSFLKWAKEKGIDEVSVQPVSLAKTHPYYEMLALDKNHLDKIQVILQEEKKLFDSKYAHTHDALLRYLITNRDCYVFNEKEQCDNFIDSNGKLWNCPLKIYEINPDNEITKDIMCNVSIQCFTCLKRRTTL